MDTPPRCRTRPGLIRLAGDRGSRLAAPLLDGSVLEHGGSGSNHRRYDQTMQPWRPHRPEGPFGLGQARCWVPDRQLSPVQGRSHQHPRGRPTQVDGSPNSPTTGDRRRSRPVGSTSGMPTMPGPSRPGTLQPPIAPTGERQMPLATTGERSPPGGRRVHRGWDPCQMAGRTARTRTSAVVARPLGRGPQPGRQTGSARVRAGVSPTVCRSLHDGPLCERAPRGITGAARGARHREPGGLGPGHRRHSMPPASRAGARCSDRIGLRWARPDWPVQHPAATARE